jgi:hypothetical protein
LNQPAFVTPESKESPVAILGGGMTGLAAGWASGLPVYEAEEAPGGICSSYYIRPGTQERLHQPPPDDEAYRATALKVLEGHDIQMVGRYARWTFQGIADSLRDGLYVGATNRLR